MADISVTAAQVAPCFPGKAEIVDVVAAAAITKGNPVYQTSSGTFGVADANGTGTRQFRGIALETVGAGQAVSVLVRGHCYGYTVSSMNGDALVYLSNTAGALADAASVGGTTVQCGRVTALTDASATKVIYVEADWRRDWS